MKYLRYIQKIIENHLFSGRVIIVYGARRVGKTTLVKNIISNTKGKSLYIDFEDPDNILLFENAGVQKLNSILKGNNIVVFDEAQKFTQIGKILKLIHDHLPDIQAIATGSSSFDLANKTGESLTGRKWEYTLYPISVGEIKNTKDVLTALTQKEQYLIYGQYPAVLDAGINEKISTLKELTSSYIIKDVFSLNDIRNPEIINKLLRLLAFQIAQEVSYNELATQLGVNQETIARYIDLLEKAFIITRLPALSRNPRKEISKSRKIYFIDLGIRNSLIQNFNTINQRNDIGQLWENFCVVERLKHNEYTSKFVNSYFWRSYQKQEIDYIEETDGILATYEIKWNNKKKAKLPQTFAKSYSNHTFEVINQDNWLEFVS